MAASSNLHGRLNAEFDGLENAPAPVRRVSMLVGGRDVDSAGGATFERHSPVSGDLVTIATAASAADAATAADAAAAAFPEWSQTSPGYRRALLERAGQLLLACQADFTALMMAETGATREWSAFNVALSARIFSETAAMTTQIGGQLIPTDYAGRTSMAYRQPAGVCLAIAPWNAPVILGVRAIAMALACGNTVILKASEACPGMHVTIGKVFVEAGFPDGVVNVITNAPADAATVVEALISAPEVRRVNFTGSTKVGRVIGELSGRHLKPALLELGGKAPMIVLDDADINAAVNGAIFGAFANMGQICMSTERLIVHEAVADEFVEKLAARAAKLPAGDPRGHVVLGSLVSSEAAAKMEGLIADAVAKGARLAAGGTRSGSVVAATVLDGVKPGMRLYDEESFGPVKPVIRVKDEDEAVEIANDTEYGLSASVYSRDVRRAMAVAARIESGICHINGPTVHDEAQMPFGGVKGSGYGRFGGKAAIAEFTDLRWITVEDPNQHYPF